jgi:hypothetical protein
MRATRDVGVSGGSGVGIVGAESLIMVMLGMASDGACCRTAQTAAAVGPTLYDRLGIASDEMR